MVTNQRLSENNKEYKFFYNSEDNYNNSSKYSINPFENFYSSRSLHQSDLDTHIKIPHRLIECFMKV